MTTFSSWLNRSSLYIALASAWIATLGSLYFSEVAGYIPCELCWYQRILMYPLSFILLVGLLRTDENVAYYVLPLSIGGTAMGLHHYLLQKGMVGHITVCAVGVPCTTAWINWLGFITIPFLSMTAFLIITVMTLTALLAGEPFLDEDEPVPWLPALGTVMAIVLLFSVIFWSGNERAAQAAGDGLTVDASLTASDAISPSIDAVAPSVDGAPATDGAPSIDGAALYAEACAACHGPDREGVAGLGNALAGSEFVAEQSDAELLAFIRAGRAADDPANASGLIMPPSGGRPDLSDAEILAIIEFLHAP